VTKTFKYVFIIIIVFLNSNALAAGWQTQLESVFDIVETFDQLQDWHGTKTDYVMDIEQMPKKLDGSSSIWNMYSNWDTPKADWIRNHGSGYVWNGTKSLCINYNNLSSDGNNSTEIIGYGPSRMSTFFGNGLTGKSGYKKICVFYMIKFREGFFARNSTNDGWEYLNGYLKTLELCSGFTGVRTWGTTADRAISCANAQVRDEYGVNYSVLNIIGGGNALKTLLCYMDSIRWAYNNSGCWAATGKIEEYRKANISNEFMNSKWVGIEIISDIGTINSANGYLTINIYNDKGSLIGTESRVNQTRLVQFDHYYNKITFGGNMNLSGGSATNENRFYIDDFIIDNDPIAEKYFKMCSDECVPGVKLNKVQGVKKAN
jgi:hypothetical protein